MGGGSEKDELRLRKFRDATAVISFIGPVIMVLGLIGKFYFDRFRLDEHDKRIEALSRSFDTIRHELHQLEIKLAETRANLRVKPR